MLEIPFSGIKKIEEVAGSSPEYVSLSQGSIKVGGIPTVIKKHIQQLLDSDSTDYYQSCWGIKPLREALTKYINTNYNPSVTIKQVLPTHGCIGGLSLLFLSLLEAGDEVLIPQPAYPAYDILAQTARCKAVHISCLKSSEPLAWEINVQAIKQATTEKTKMLIFSNPWNPLGIVVAPHVINELLSWCEERGIYMVIDEAYREYVFEGEFQSGLTLINKSDMLISANSFSKNMAMSGWRAGYLVVSEKLSHALAGMQDALLNCLNNVAQEASLYAINHPELSKPFHEIVKQNRNRAIELLQPLKDQGIIDFQAPSGGFFVLVKTLLDDASDLALDILYKAKVGVVPGSTFGESAKSCLRICFARNPEVLEEGMRRLIGYLEATYALGIKQIKTNQFKELS